jgi:hypothetical protein
MITVKQSVPMKIAAKYVSNFEEGQVETECELNLKLMKIDNISVAGCDYETLISEFLEFQFGSYAVSVELVDQEISEEDVIELKRLFLRLSDSE